MHDLLLMRNSAVSGNSEDKTLYIKVLLYGTQDYTSMHTVSTKDTGKKKKGQEYVAAAIACVPVMSLQILRGKREGQCNRQASFDSA